MSDTSEPMSFDGSKWQQMNRGRAQSFVAWQCPACGCGVRHDVEVCPNCVKRAGGELTFGAPVIIHENSEAALGFEEEVKRRLAPTEKPNTRSGGHG
jgi:RNA polymerase subunit RPABC4/transcription elongation factor Spt4